MAPYKQYGRRLNEILEAGTTLFVQKGYEKTTVNDILEKVGIGKGTFYHYFSSKEEVMDAVVQRAIDQFVEDALAVVDEPDLTAEQKFAKIILGQAGSFDLKAEMIEELHQTENAKMHQKSIVQTIIGLVPILTDVVKQGLEEGTFHTPYPQETIELLLVADQFLFDSGVFAWTPEEIVHKAQAFVHAGEMLLGMRAGSLNYIAEYYQSHLKEPAHEQTENL